MKNTKTFKNNRYYLIDSIRGFWIINMVIFHFLYDLFVIFCPNGWCATPLVLLWERFIACSFILVSGISINFSKNAFKRGLILNVFGFIITVVTILFIPSETIWFGILNLLGCSMLIFQIFRKQAEKVKPFTGAIISFLLFSVSYGVPYGYIGFFDLRILNLPSFFYSTDYLAFLGFPSANFSSSDYFPLIPWIFMFFTGFFAWKIIKDINADNFFKRKIPVLDSIGRKSIWIYILHQPVIFGIFLLINI